MIFGLFFLLECFAVSCRKDPENFETRRNPLSFSTDTVCFDTVFSTLNVPVQRFTIHNPGKKPVKISRIHIRPGESGYGSESFRFTVNGDTSAVIRDLVVHAGDSLFVFVRSGIHLSGQNLPFIVDAYFQCDIAESQSSQSVYLYAYGQDAHYWHPDRIYARPYPNAEQPNVVDTQYIPYFVWAQESHPFTENDKPYAIFGYLTVPAGQTLEIPPGTRLHFGPDAGIWVQQGGRLQINGSIDRPVRLGGLRLDTTYYDQAGQWGHIWLDAESGDHLIRYAVIENGSSGVWLDSAAVVSGLTPSLTIENTIIRYMTNYGIIAYRNSMAGVNLVVSHCGKTVSLRRGGHYEFVHCTFANYAYNGYSLEMYDEKTSGATQAFESRFTNSIFYGSSYDQLNLDVSEDHSTPYRFDHCLIRQRHVTNFGDIDKFSACSLNQDPKFHNTLNNKADFRIADTTSAAFRKGSPTAVSGQAITDITGYTRPLYPQFPTIGAYEYQPID
ncbi:MAG: right-handed parallel beta-helix repeat-containing protein [Bacteroidales bacterium]|nr:right-handed parallel beta-helix repeat-containing protein [Bacteroidales bacterium]